MPQQTETEELLRNRLAEVQAQLAELAKPPEAGAGIGFGKRIGDGTNEAISRRNDIGVGNSLLVTEEKLERALAKLDGGQLRPLRPLRRADRAGAARGRPRERPLHRLRPLASGGWTPPTSSGRSPRSWAC